MLEKTNECKSVGKRTLERRSFVRMNFCSLKVPFDVEHVRTQEGGLADPLAGKEILGTRVVETCSNLQCSTNCLCTFFSPQ